MPVPSAAAPAPRPHPAVRESQFGVRAASREPALSVAAGPLRRVVSQQTAQESEVHEPANAETVRRSFAVQAHAFEDPTRTFGSADVAAWMTEHSPTRATDIVLEVAAGTGLFGRALAPLVAAVVAVDLTPEMLREGQRGADSAELSNVVFQLADGTQLPFLDRSFDRVISRLAIHHFDDPLSCYGRWPVLADGPEP